MARTRSVDFLPEIFRTPANKQFLSATLDNLIQEPKFKKTQGFIGRTVGPGVNPNDKYVVELNKTRADYQLEPGVVSLKPDTNEIQDVITYPGIADAISFQGGTGSRADRLYQSDYYTWDPFINFDTFVNFSQYYWLPAGPAAVSVASAGVPISQSFTVNRENGVYTFNGVVGNNPTIELVRGGTYTFNVAQNQKETVNYSVGNNGITAYTIDNIANPALTLVRGNTYVFNLTLTGVYPFWIKTEPLLGLGSTYNDGVTRNGSTSGLITFTVPQDAPDTLYYISQNQSNMQGVLNIVDGTPGTGPGFWIQTNPGVNGRVPTTPNISSRDVEGVINNGEDLGVVTFNVPLKTEQEFYYNLTTYSQPVDLVTSLRFDQINNQSVNDFIAQYGGIDGVTNLNGRTLVFINNVEDAEAGGWQRTTFFDPLEAGAANNNQIGSFDTTTFDQSTEIPLEQRYQLWQIDYVNYNNVNYINVAKVADVPELNKFTVRYGATYSNTNWYKNPQGKFSQIPLLTALLDTLYYQDGTDPEIFGQIKLLDQTERNTIFIDDILGKTNYTSPNGVTFTNGLKVIFQGDVVPASYSTGNVEFVCSATTAGTNTITVPDTSFLYVGQQLVFVSPTIGGIIAGNTYYVHSIVNNFNFTISSVLGGSAVTLTTNIGTMRAIGINYREYYVSGVGTGIELLPVTDFVTPESYIVDANDSTIAAEPGEIDYITIDRASQDLNPWSRSNRWFHIDVINATAEYNNTVAELDNNYRAKRPIIQFRPNIRLFNMGTEGKQAIDIIDFAQTDAFSNIEGSTGYSVDGYTFINGTRVVFAADEDADVRNKIWVVEFVTPNSAPVTTAGNFQPGLVYTIVSLGNTNWNAAAGTTGVTYAVGDTFVADNAGTGTGVATYDQPVIHLNLASDGIVLVDQSTVCLSGNTTQGITYWYDGTAWTEAQQKTGVQQAPLFNVYDVDGVSFSDTTKYPASDFAGSKLFSYAVGDTAILDPILKFPLKYLNINNVGDIQFENNLYVDTFVYTRDNVSVTLDISSGSIREYADRTTYERFIGWQDAVTTTKDYQQFKFIYDTGTLKLDVRVRDRDSVPVIKLYVGSKFQDPSKYSYITTEDSTTITLNETYVPGDIVEVLVLSDQVSTAAFYQVPLNLQNNPFNANSKSFTLGTIRQHYQSICENLPDISGVIDGANNTRDLGNLVPYGLIILQQSSPVTLAGYFLRSPQYNIFAALNYNSQEYTKFKYQMLESVTQQTIQFETPAQILDTAIESLTQGKVESQSFYWTDMLPFGAIYTETVYNISFITGNVFDTVQVYDYTSANYLGMNVYLNDEILIRNLDYTVAVDGPRVTILAPLTIGDVLTIREYSATYGNFVPNTPTKMGLYPAWRPEITVQKTSTGEQTVIIGHDGSVTKTFGDIRDAVLLEFETRIFNNIKLDGNPVPLTVTDVLPGQFRDTGYSLDEINNILNQDFLSYVAWNKLDYKQQDYNAANEFTWNYSSSTNKLNNEPLLGAWRGIYRYFYDTQQPQYTPWEMLGFTIKPEWWDLTYGSAPYTAENMVLWDDLEAGYVRDPVSPYILPEYARPGLSQVIPTGPEGELLSPLNSVVGNYDTNQFRRSWSPGDGSPVEASWWNSSNYPFAVMRLLALTRPAKFFALFADRDLYKYNSEFNQYLYNNRYRLDANGVEVYGNGVSKASYINWIVDYNRLTGLNSTDLLQQDLANLDVRLCYRMASFSDKQFIKLYTEKSSPNSTNTSFLIPDESYNLVLYKNQPFDRASYSSVLVQRVVNGYAVFGYSTTQPFFNIQQSQTSGRLESISAAGATVRVPTAYTSTVTSIPYGYIFSNETGVADFLLSYGEYMQRQGLTFDSIDNGYQLDWTQMVREFLYWSQQGWQDNSLIALNPLALRLSVTKPRAVVDSIRAQTQENVLLDQNRRELPTRNLNIVRLNNTFTVEPTTDQSLSFIDLKYTSYEHMIVLDNVSVFGDLIYDPITGARQSRLNLVAVTTTEWNGSVDAQGFILNQNNVQEWTGLRTYAKGEIVKYKDGYWSAAKIVQPSELFNFNDWIQSDYTKIEQGLLPNLANKADQLINSYNINGANLERDNDLLSYGLIGFRPRQYLSAINLDDTSQVNVYRQFLDTKGTVLSAELFRQVDLGKELADYQIFENWAVQRAVYGANANRSFFELRLNRALLDASPSLIQVVNPQQSSQADQTILLGNVWRQSFKLTSPDILPVTTQFPTDTALPSAGYVNLEDADITVFDLNTPNSLESNINNISVGTSIWVAKVNDYDWNIYRAESVPGTISHVCDNLDQTSLVIFTTAHELEVGDRIIIRFFDSEVDGVYDVLTVPGIDKVTIAFSFTGDRTVVNGTGIAFTLQTQRVTQASDVVNLPYADEIQPGNRVWVDDDGTGHWVVLEKQDVFSAVTTLSAQFLDATEGFGASVSQSSNRFSAMVGSPRYGFQTGTESGGVYIFVKNFSDVYQPVSPVDSGDAVLTLDNSGTRGFGSTVKFGNQDWGVAGAPGSLGSSSQTNNGYACVIYRDPTIEPGNNPYATWQLLTTPGSVSVDQGRFGAAVAMSLDERWMYIGAPDVNRVYAYGLVDWQDQFVKAVGNGSTTVYSIASAIQISANTQIRVLVDSTVLTLGTDYTVNASFTAVTFVSAPANGANILIQRINEQQLDAATYYSVSGSGGSGSGVLFTIRRQRGQVGQSGATAGSVEVQFGGIGYNVGNTITILATAFGGGVNGVNNITVTVTAVSSGVITAVSVPTYTAPALTTVFSLNEYFFTVSDIYSFSVLVNSVLYRPNIDYTFNNTTKDITFLTSPAAGSEIIVRAKGYYDYVATLSVPGMTASTSSTSLTIGIGSKSLTVSSGLAYEANQSIRIVNSDSNYMLGTITSYDNSTGALVVAVGSVLGSGTYASWTVVPDCQFGYSIECTTDGRQVMIGSCNNTVDGEVKAGQVYVFDRNVQSFIYNNDTSTINFTLLGTPVSPISVLVNNQRLINQTDSVVNAPNSFYWNGSNTVTVNTDLSAGDLVEIETNQFVLQQTIAQDTPAEFSNYGQAVDVCAYNCSLYVGAPQSSHQVYKGGVVERQVNQSRVYGTISATVTNPTLTVGNTLRVNNIDCAVPAATATTTSLQGLANNINANVPNAVASVTAGVLTIAVKNSAAAPIGNKIQVAPGSVGTAFADLGFETFVFAQTILSPYAVTEAAFGSSLSIDETATTLAVGAPNGSLYLVTIFDDGTTDFDANATSFFSLVDQSGAVYTYNLLNSVGDTVTNPGKFVFGNQIGTVDMSYLGKLGQAVDYTSGVLWAGAPGNDLGDSTNSNDGSVLVYQNADRLPSWVPIRVQQPTVDIRLLNSVFLYNLVTASTTEFLDFFNPLQGKILGAAKQNIDYIGAVDPASYNVGPVNVRGTTWGQNHVGEIWWDISSVRFIDPNQDDIVYASRRWGQTFPGSSIDVYQWIVSPVPPAEYTGPGTPLNVLSYSVNSVLGDNGVFSTEYFFWVRGLTTVATSKGKTLSANTISNYIQDPRSTGIAYLAPINASTVAVYNCETLIEASDTVLHIEFDRELTDDNVHVEYELIAQDRPSAFLSSSLYRKFQDSLCGVDTAGNLVPDQTLSPAERYGVQFRPRQSMFVDRFLALKNYIIRVNSVLARFPITESRSFTLLNSAEPEPSASTNLWNIRLANDEILSFQNIYAVPLGYSYLIVSDASNQGLWTIYTVTAVEGNPGQRQLTLTRVQNYNTPDYWSHINWYRPGYNSSVKPVAEVPNFASLSTLDVAIGSSVKVTANSQGKFEIYLKTDLGFERVGLEDGTIEISAEIYNYALGRFGFDVEVFDAQYFDQEPVIETRKIIQAINEELLIDDLEIERNRALVLMFNFVLSEFSAPEWLVKTSLVDVDHKIRELLPFQNYSRDNQEFVIDYIQEVKPYHVSIREFNLKYFGSDTYFGDITDFDLPAYFNTSLAVPQFTSPVLLPYDHGTAEIDNVNSDVTANDPLWASWPYNQWFNNYLLDIDSIKIVESGSGYSEAPVVEIIGPADVPAQAIAVVNSVGQVVAITVTDPGSGYRSAPEVQLVGGNGSGARAYPVLTNGLVRNFRTTIKYDRTQYQTSVQTWSASGTYENGTLVRYDDRVWRAESADGSTAVVGPTFDLENWQLVPANELTGVDRTMGLYVPGVNEPGLELPLLIDGVDYPGVQVYGQNFDVVEPELTESLDTIYRSSFTDQYLGTRFSDINVDGGQFVGPYEGHAPEELVNGSEYDTLDIRVYTRPGADWQGNGHGFQVSNINYIYNSVTNYVLSWADLVETPVEIIVSNQTTGLVLQINVDYTVSWVNQTITILPGRASTDNVINIALYEIGGGNQLYRLTTLGSEIEDSTVIVPVNDAEIDQIAVFFDGEISAVPTWQPYYDAPTWDIQQSYAINTKVIYLGVYYRAMQAVPPGAELDDPAYWTVFVPTLLSKVTLGVPPTATQGVTIVVIGPTTVPAGRFVIGRTYTIQTLGNTNFMAVGAASNTVGVSFTATGEGSGSGTATTNYSWSTPQVQIETINQAMVDDLGFVLQNNIGGTNPANMIVLVNGERLVPPAGIEWFGDDTTVSFGLPQRLGQSFLQSSINPITDIQVWVDNILQTQSFGAFVGQYSVTNWTGSNTPGRQVVFNVPPPSGARILVTVSTLADYFIAGNSIQFNSIPVIGDRVQVITWNDTSQQNLLTQIFIGPVSQGIVIEEPYDSTDFDAGLVTGGAGSFDYSAGTSVNINDFDLQRENVQANKLWVTLDGVRLFEGQDYTVQGQYLVLASGAIGLSQVLSVTQFTNSVVPEAMAFRIFQDMRGVQATYRITPATTTALAQPLSAEADIMYVTNAAALTQPDLPAGRFGVVTVDGERIMYRERDTVANTLIGLRRGTAGTAAASHATGAAVYDLGRGNLMLEQYQDYVVSDSTLADGSTINYTAPSITAANFDDSTSIFTESIEVYVGGVRQYNLADTTATSQYPYTVISDSPVTVQFYVDSDPVSPVVAPPEGAEVTILQRRGTGWYGAGESETNGLALQETDTYQARFLRGE